MPNLVLEKNGQAYRFELNSDKSVTNGKAVPVTYNGVDYYARYGNDVTPLKIEVNGQTYYIQYDAIEFARYYWERRASDTSGYSTTLFFPKGRYRVTLEGSNKRSWDISINDNGNKTVSIQILGSGYNQRLECSISGSFNNYLPAGQNWNRVMIERVGE
jgi:hypothetical protein